MSTKLLRVCVRACVVMLMMLVQKSYATEFDFLGISGNVNAKLSEGAAWRVEPQDARLIYKQNINPFICGSQSPGVGAACYSQNDDRTLNQRLLAAPGAFNPNADDGDLNYKQGQLVAALTKLNIEATASWKDFTFKAGAFAFYDPRNYSLGQNHPDTSYQAQRDSLDRNSEVQQGMDFVLKDALVATKVNVLEHDFAITAGWQHIRWGESTLVALNSISEINAPDARALHQPSTDVSDVFRPTPAIQFGTSVAENVNLDLVYLFGWDPVEVPYGGTFYSNVDVYKKSGYLPALLAEGQFHEDPFGRQSTPGLGAFLSPSTQNGDVDRLPHDRWHQGQFGGKLNFFLSDFNGGTEVSLYALDYKSRLPYASFIAANKTCIKDTTTDIVTAVVIDCNGANFIPGGGNPLPVDTPRSFFEYPGHIQLYGASFNTNIGKWSFAGEASWRPNFPVQVQANDLSYSSNNPAIPFHAIPVSATILATNIAQFFANPANAPYFPTAVQVLASPGFAAVAGSFAGGSGNGSATTILPGRRDLLPDFVSGYRGYTTQPNQYIRGYERLNALQLDLTGIRALGATDNPFGADQIILISELGMSYFPDMPSKGELQFEAGDVAATHATPGADGSGDRTGDVNADGTIHHDDGSQGSYVSERFTPTEKRTDFATPFSTGYRLIARFEYDNIFDFGINYKPHVVFAHDVLGRAPLPAQNFIQGRKTYEFVNEFELSQQWNVQVFYLGSTGGGTVNSLRDRDSAGFTLSFTF